MGNRYIDLDIDSGYGKIVNSHLHTIKKDKENHGHGLKDNFNEIVKELKENPFAPTQSFEKLEPKSAGLYSRRINQQHRVVYKVDEVARRGEIYSTCTHYE